MTVLGMMTPQFDKGNVRANCDGCGGAVSTFEYRSGQTHEFGTVVIPRDRYEFEGRTCQSVIYKLLRCAGCGRGAIAVVHKPHNQEYSHGFLEKLIPSSLETFPIPESVPDPIRREFREAEVSASVLAWRAAAAMLRSTLEKALKANGYDEKGTSLEKKIDLAVADGIITAARGRRAHEDIRVLGNDVLHDEWREVTAHEYDEAHHYSQRILEDFYDDRESVEKILREKKRIT